MDRVEMRRGPEEVDKLDASYRAMFAEIRGIFRARGVPREEANDLAQETVLLTLVHLRRHGQIGQDLRPLFHTIARNLLIGRVRKRQPEFVSLRAGEEVVDNAQQPLDEVLARERRSAVRAALRSISPRQRRILELWMDGLSPSRMARQLGIKRNAVDALLYRARRSLASKLSSSDVTLSIFGVMSLRLRWMVRRIIDTFVGFDPSGSIGHAATGLAALGLAAVLAAGAAQHSGRERSVRLGAAQQLESRPAPVAAFGLTHGSKVLTASDATSSAHKDRRIGVDANPGTGEERGVGFGVIHRRDQNGQRGVAGPLVDRALNEACGPGAQICDEGEGP